MEAVRVIIELDPKPKNDAVPTKVSFWCLEELNGIQIYSMARWQPGQHVKVPGVIYPPMQSLRPGRNGEFFKLRTGLTYRIKNELLGKPY